MTTPTAAPSTTAVAPESTNVLSVVAFVLSLVGFNVIAIVLGFIGLSQVKKTGQRGRGFALAAVIIGFASIVLFALIFIPLVVMAASSSVAIS
ncbi:uncharacterized protein DUF4190 [Microterricola gilva]|uniref:Uncharacterized protein DUF4190 n=1 Tax=Microterricola gilva TaxID=393267 RepID=A0A4Q8AHH3_9MICO|nr:DUF4190 domain-containing protein [Microterricola gilva]RZU63764.1 uncharacterized protein DUF4190 [Microterricola gilva]